MRHRKLLIGIGVLATAFAVGFLWGRTHRPAMPSPQPAAPLAEIGVPTSANPDFDPASWRTVRVRRVIDGDTVELENGDRLRLIGIDAPERGTCFSEEATALLSALVEDRSLRLERGITERDRYGRLLGYLHDGSTFVNEVLVLRGAAVASPYPPDTIYAERFRNAEESARAAKRGLWGVCGGFAEPPSPAPPSSAECAIKGNIASSGEKIYHLPGCASYEEVRIDEAAGERWFCTEEEAQRAGFRRAKNCPQ